MAGGGGGPHAAGDEGPSWLKGPVNSSNPLKSTHWLRKGYNKLLDFLSLRYIDNSLYCSLYALRTCICEVWRTGTSACSHLGNSCILHTAAQHQNAWMSQWPPIGAHMQMIVHSGTENQDCFLTEIFY